MGQIETYLEVIKAPAGAIEKNYDLSDLPGFLSTLVTNDAISDNVAQAMFDGIRSKQTDGLSGFLSHLTGQGVINDKQAQDIYDVLKNDDILERIPEALDYLVKTGTLTGIQAQGWNDVIEAVGLDIDDYDR